MMAPAAQRMSAGAPTSRRLTFHELPGPQPRQFFLYRPSTEVRGRPAMVSVHGLSRNAVAHAYRLMEQAERYGLVIVAPLFSKERYGLFQQLQDPRTGVRADYALNEILDAAGRLTSADTGSILLFGYSGGAQFAHRFVMAYPRAVRSAALAAAGWYTFPDASIPYPYGLGAQDPALQLDSLRALEVPTHVYVGALDVERDASLRRSRELDRSQGRTRIERANRWVSAIRALARDAKVRAPTTLSVLDGVGHSFQDSIERAGLAELVFGHFAEDAGLQPVTP